MQSGVQNSLQIKAAKNGVEKSEASYDLTEGQKEIKVLTMTSYKAASLTF
jgi:hypothetical protein